MERSSLLSLAWSEHHNFILSGLQSLLHSSQLTDVLLWCGPKCFRAHKIVLALCSDYFATVFNASNDNNNLNTVIYLKDVLPHHMEILLNFMYSGGVSVEEKELVDLLSTAKGLGIKGLTDYELDSTEISAKKRRRVESAASKKAKEVLIDDDDEPIDITNDNSDQFDLNHSDTESATTGIMHQDEDLSPLDEHQDDDLATSTQMLGRPEDFFVTRGKSGGPLYVSGQFGYVVRSRHGKRIYLDCCDRKCYGTAKLEGDKLIPKRNHSCSGMSSREFRLLEIENEMKIMAENCLESPTDIIEQVLRKNEDLRQHVKVNSLKVVLAKRREKALQLAEQELIG